MQFSWRQQKYNFIYPSLGLLFNFPVCLNTAVFLAVLTNLTQTSWWVLLLTVCICQWIFKKTRGLVFYILDSYIKEGVIFISNRDTCVLAYSSARTQIDIEQSIPNLLALLAKESRKNFHFLPSLRLVLKRTSSQHCISPHNFLLNLQLSFYPE